MEPLVNLFLWYFCVYFHAVGIGIVEGKGPGTYSKVFATGEVKEGGDYTPAEYLKWRQDTVDYINQLRFGYEDEPIVLDLKLCEKSQFWSTNLTLRNGKDDGPKHSPFGTENVFGGSSPKPPPEQAVNSFHAEIKNINLTDPQWVSGEWVTGHYCNMIAPAGIGSLCPSFSHSVKDRQTAGAFLFGERASGGKIKKLSNADLVKKAKGQLTCYFCDENFGSRSSRDQCMNAEDKYTIYCGGKAKACKTRNAYDRAGNLVIWRTCDYKGESQGRMGCRDYVGPDPDPDSYNYWYKNTTDCYCDKPNCNNKVFAGPIQTMNSLYKSQGAIKCSVCDGVGKGCLQEANDHSGYCLPYIKSCKLREGYDRDRRLNVWRECDVGNQCQGFVGCRPYTGPVGDTGKWSYWYSNGTECCCNKDGCNAEKWYSFEMMSLDSLYKSKGAIKCSVCEGESTKCLKEPGKSTEYCTPDVKTCLLREAYTKDGKLKVWRSCDKRKEGKGFLGCRPYAGPVPDTDHWNYWYKNGTECFCDKDDCNQKVYTDDMLRLDFVYNANGAMKCSTCEGSGKHECLQDPKKSIQHCPSDTKTCRVREAYDRDKKLKVWRECDNSNESKGFLGCRPYTGPVPDTDHWNYWFRNGTDCYCTGEGCNAEKVYTEDMLSLDALYKSKGAIKCSNCVGAGKECLQDPKKSLQYCSPDAKACRLREAYDRDKKLNIWRECDNGNESKGFVGCRPYTGPVPDTDHWNYWFRNGTECYCKEEGCNAQKVFTDDMMSLDALYKAKGAISCHVCEGSEKTKTCLNVSDKKSAGYCSPNVKACKLRDAYDRDGKLKVWRECDLKNESEGFLGCRKYGGPNPDTDHFNYWYKNATDCYCNKDNCNDKLYTENLYKI